jgi:hypothetical protein
MGTGEFCENLLSYGSIRVLSSEHVGAVMIALAIFYFTGSLVIIYWIKIQERYAKLGNDISVQSVIFPVFVQALWINAVVNVYVGIVMLSFNYIPYENSTDRPAIWAFSTMWALQHSMTEGVAVLLMQKGLGRNGAIRTIKIVISWGLISLFVQWAGYNASLYASVTIEIIYNLFLIAFYMAIWLVPLKNLYRRPAAIPYAKFWAIFRIVALINAVLYAIPATEYTVAECFYTFGTLYPFALFEPFVMYFTFLQDSRWWQGLDISTSPLLNKEGTRVHSQTGPPTSSGNHHRISAAARPNLGKAGTPMRISSNHEIRSPLQGVDLDLKSAQTLAASIDDLGVSPHRYKNKSVRLLNFAYISLDKSKLLGQGSFSKVYLGKYRQRPCAIKLIFTIDVTQEIICRVAAEAQILSTIRHTNVVEILGVSVLPPSCCILLELCAFGSLNDVIGGTGYAALATIPNFITHFLKGSSIIGKYSNRGLNISWNDRLFLAIGCAKGLSALHSLKPDVCHRDVKSFNFLVDEQLNAKISDLELGITDDLMFSNGRKTGGATGASGANHHRSSHHNNQRYSQHQQQVTVPKNSSRPDSDRLTVDVTARVQPTSSQGNYFVCMPHLLFNSLFSYVLLLDRLSETKQATVSQDTVSSVDKSSSSTPTSATKVPLSGLSVDSRSSSGKISIDTLSDIFDNEGASQLHGDDFLANWAAPEVIKDAYHSQASDIYSFGLVLWEIIVGIVPFSEVKRQDDIREKVLKGIRPEIPYIFTDEPPYDYLFLPYVELIKKCWNPEPLLRPNINHILEKLESLYRKQCYDILSETSAIERLIEENNQLQANDGKPRLSTKSFFRPQNYGSTLLHRSSMALSQFDVGQLSECFPMFLSSFLSFLSFSLSLAQIADYLQDEGGFLDAFNEKEQAWCLVLPDSSFTVVWGSSALEETLCVPLKEMIGRSLYHLTCFEGNSRKDSADRFNANKGGLWNQISGWWKGEAKEVPPPAATSETRREEGRASMKSIKRKEKNEIFFTKLRETRLGNCPSSSGSSDNTSHFLLDLIVNRFRAISSPSNQSAVSAASAMSGLISSANPATVPDLHAGYKVITATSLYSVHSFPVASVSAPSQPIPINISENINANNDNNSSTTTSYIPGSSPQQSTMRR